MDLWGDNSEQITEYQACLAPDGCTGGMDAQEPRLGKESRIK